MIDKTAVACRFRRSVDSYEENATVQKWIVDRLSDLMYRYVPVVPRRMLEVGCGTGFLTAKLKTLFTCEDLFINDLVDDMCRKTANKCQLPLSHCLAGDIESIELPADLDLIVSSSTFQWFTNPRRTCLRLFHALLPGGYLIFSSFGENNFSELKSITGKGLVYRPLDAWVRFLSAYFDIIHCEETIYRLEFNDPLEVLQHVKRTGVNATTAGQVWTRERLNHFSQEYVARFGINGHCPLTYHPIYLICRKRLQFT